MAGQGVCYMHGGATPRGEASPHYRHGRRRRRIPSRYRRLLKGPLTESERGAILEGALMDLLQSIQTEAATPDQAQAIQALVLAIERIEEGRERRALIRLRRLHLQTGVLTTAQRDSLVGLLIAAVHSEIADESVRRGIRDRLRQLTEGKAPDGGMADSPRPAADGGGQRSTANGA